MKNRRSPSLAATPVLSPEIARAAVWVELGAVARSRGIGWRSGLAAVFGVYYNRHVFEDPFGHHLHFFGYLTYNKDVLNEPNDVIIYSGVIRIWATDFALFAGRF